VPAGPATSAPVIDGDGDAVDDGDAVGDGDGGVDVAGDDVPVDAGDGDVPVVVPDLAGDGVGDVDAVDGVGESSRETAAYVAMPPIASTTAPNASHAPVRRGGACVRLMRSAAVPLAVVGVVVGLYASGPRYATVRAPEPTGCGCASIGRVSETFAPASINASRASSAV